MISKKILTEFAESYDETAMDCIMKLNDTKYVFEASSTINVIKLEDCDKFNKFMEGFVEYKVEELHSETKDKFTDIESIHAKTSKFIESLHYDTVISANKCVEFIEGYLECVRNLDYNIDKCQHTLITEGASPSEIGFVVDMYESYIDRLTSRFSESMNSILYTSGYLNIGKSLLDEPEYHPEDDVIFT